jgi:pyrrolysine biosynthesis protein PylD
MSRLTEFDIKHIPFELKKNDERNRDLFGFTLKETALMALNLTFEPAPKKCAVVPVVSGLGIIGGFSETVRAILEYCGAYAFVTEKSDVSGVWQAYSKKADLIFMADDDICAAFATSGFARSENGYATGIGFAAALEMMNGGAGDCIVLGAGMVGKAAIKWLSEREWRVAVYDTNPNKTAEAARSAQGIFAENTPRSVRKYRNILYAANTPAFITADDVTDETNISAPGMPFGATKEAAAKARLFHNPLELGIMVMYFDCAAQLEVYHGNKETGHQTLCQ